MRKHATLFGAVLLGLVSAVSYAQAPVPFINLPLVPDATAPGGAQFTLTVNGTGFVSNSVVNWNGSALATQFVSGSQLTATVPAADIATASTGRVTVVTPAPGGGTSSAAYFSVTRNEGKSVGFGLASSPAVGPVPEGAAVGDFNGDGKLDLAVTNGGGNGNTVSILLGDGKGNFTLTSTLTVGYFPNLVFTGDFNGDGKLDLVVTDIYSNTLSVLLGDGNGNFTLVSSPVLDSWPDGVAVGDFNGDGKLDLAAVGVFGDLWILLGDGTGNFNLVSSTDLCSWPQYVAVGDFNGDGKLDLAVTCGGNGGNQLSILLGDGTGNFTLVSSLTVGVGDNTVVAGDWNGDGKLDLATSNANDNTVSILLGDGTGNFTVTSTPKVGSGPNSLAVGDFNADGKPDLAVSNSGDNTVSILLGDGTGNFTLASSPAVGSDPGFVVVGDFNGDGKLDLATPNTNDNTVSILLHGVPLATLSPPNLGFGTQLVGSSSSSQPVTLTNTGVKTLSISKIAVSGSFSQTNNCPTTVPAGGRCTINVIFTPSRIGKLAGTLAVKDNAPTSPQKVPLTGVGTVVTLLPSSLNFGDQKVGTTSQPQVATLTNYGTLAVSISRIHIAGKHAGAFAQTNNCGISVPAGGSCTISVTFAPKYKGPKGATLEVGDNGGGGPQTVVLHGTGT